MPRVCLLQTKLSPVKVESTEHVKVCANVNLCGNVNVKGEALFLVGVMRKKIVCQKILEGGRGCKL